MGTFRHGKFWARDILEPEHLGTWIFWHLAKQYGTDILGPVVLCQNVPVPKIPSYQKVPMMKCFRFEISGCRSQCRMVHIPKCSRDETSVLK